jgi:hypothetical protein
MESIRRSMMGCVPWLSGMTRATEPKPAPRFTAVAGPTVMVTIGAGGSGGGGGTSPLGPLRTAAGGVGVRR